MGKMIYKFMAVIAVLIWSVQFSILMGQTGFSGTVVEEAGPLSSVTVSVVGTARGTLTNGEGKFRLSGLDAGTYTLRFSFIGYTTIEQEVSLGSDEVTDLGTIKMEVSAVQLKEVVLTGTYLPSQIRALNIQKQAPGIMNVLASDAIGKLPDRNAAEAVQRIQGVSIERDHGEGRYVIVRGTPIKWNSNLINGNRLPSSEGTSNDTGGDRAVPLDIFPSEMIQFVQLSKAITPDMEGDAIGGSVNFITRTAPYQRTLNISLAGGMNDQARAGTYNGSLLYGDRFLNNKLGVIASVAVWDRNWGTDNYEVAYNADLEDPVRQFSVAELELRDYLGRRRTIGANLGAEYNFNDNNKIYLRGIYSLFTDDESAREHIFNFNDQEATIRTRNGITQIGLSGGELGGDHQLSSRVFWDWKVATYQNEMRSDFLPSTEDPDSRGYLIAFFDQPATFEGLSDDGFKYLEGDAPAGVTGDHHQNIQPRMTNPFNADSSILSLLYTFQLASLERDMVGQTNLTIDINQKLKLKVGGKYRMKYREGGAPLTISFPAAFFGVPGTSVPLLSDFQTEEFPANGGYLTEIGGNYSDILQQHITHDELVGIFTQDGKDRFGSIDIVQDSESPDAAAGFYNGYENVIAGYAMAEYHLSDKIMLIGGVRHEITSLEYNGNQVTNDGNEEVISPITNSSTTHAFLPMVHVKISPNENANIRAAYTRTFARPDFTDLNPGSTVDEINRVIVRGNPTLQPTFANNFDLMGEYYFDNVGILSGGFFYKQITNDIFNSTNLTSINGNQYVIVEPRNLEKGYLMGLELGISRRFSNLPGFMSGFGIDANYTFTESEVDVPTFSIDQNTGEVVKTITPQKLPSQADHIFNASLFYEKYGLLVRLASNYKGSYIVSFSDFGPEHNRYYGANLTLDFSAAYKISKRIRVFAEINNLTNAPLYYYHGVDTRPEQVEYYSIRGQLGLRFEIFE